jgi:hypothetical protein
MLGREPEITVTSVKAGTRATAFSNNKPAWKAVARGAGFQFTATGAANRREAEKTAIKGLRTLIKTHKARTI